MVMITPNAKNHEGLAALASRYVDVASLPWTPTRFKGVEMKLLMGSSSRRSCWKGRWKTRKVRPRSATMCGARPAAGTMLTHPMGAWPCRSS
jgi:hypothetical protein